MNIAGVIIDTLPGREQALQERLAGMPGVEIHAITDERRMVVTVEADDAGTLADILTDFHNMPDVISASTVYHHFEEDEEEVPDEIEQA